MPKKVSIGDILEVPTKKGLAYVQFSHYHDAPPRMGAIIRILPGFFKERPKEFQNIADQKELYYTLFPVQAAVNREIFSVVGHAIVPPQTRNFPLFRAGNTNPQTGKVDQWWLWDGYTSWRIRGLTDEQLDLSIKAGWNDVCLINRIEQGWTPRHAEAFRKAARLKLDIQKQPSVVGIRHFVLFQNKIMADQAKQLIDAAGFDSEIIDNGSGFSLIVWQPSPFTDEYVESTTVQLAKIATQTGGRYDAWETALK